MAPPSRDPVLIKEIVNEVVSQVIICMPSLINKDVPLARPIFDPNRQIANTTTSLITNDRNFSGEKERQLSQMQET